MMKLNWSDVTPHRIFLDRRKFMAAGAAAVALPGLVRAQTINARPSPLSTDQTPNTFEEITNYNNFYEFGTGKEDPARNAGALTTDPWSVEVAGLVDRPGSYGVEDLAPDNALEERIYRLRCVEAWSMVVPWIGVPLASVLAKVGVQPSAKFVEFETLVRPEEMIGQQRAILDWPYREGLRLDEAMHPLTILATGLYDQPMPNQNGAPIRLVVPWKYGFKSIKSIVRINLLEQEPVNTWKQLQASEYGFYANVNPQVDHPRWSQATERVIGAGLFGGRKETLMFNGYGDQVASLYAGMDLSVNY
ncbi:MULTISPECIES: protein-methionine-sulfoxide reductase catalytic subunit MsrP [Paracoccus]|jgi:sulfoxide reductase catalytic subunit YedY|nr:MULTISPECIES: protein-methionine-sulfoxide reductase catalytic subunit MsrP [Paracoccus]KIX17275.1 sulfoxide reductase catalytic subunit YedY [Paracoccus sp. 228]KJZ30736.1 sulfoxide reductase catalytic subunit YedY [Paracoccus sp. S4493]|tara:strand:- start:754 stop:1665 length:912 start_codon:yes stop_codon:yes gene_type:complete